MNHRLRTVTQSGVKAEKMKLETQKKDTNLCQRLLSNGACTNQHKDFHEILFLPNKWSLLNLPC